MLKRILIYVGIIVLAGVGLVYFANQDLGKIGDEQEQKVIDARQSFESALANKAVRKGIIYHPDIDALSKQEINLFVSFSNKTKVGAVPKEAEVFITNEDILNNYCEVNYYPDGPDSAITGWLSCDWIVKL